MNSKRKELIREIAIDCGFQLKKTNDDGTGDLHGYVYLFAEKMAELGMRMALEQAVLGEIGCFSFAEDRDELVDELMSNREKLEGFITYNARSMHHQVCEQLMGLLRRNGASIPVELVARVAATSPDLAEVLDMVGSIDVQVYDSDVPQELVQGLKGDELEQKLKELGVTARSIRIARNHHGQEGDTMAEEPADTEPEEAPAAGHDAPETGATKH